MEYSITKDDFHILEIIEGELFSREQEKYSDGLDLFEYVKCNYPDDIDDSYKKLAELVIKLQIQLSLAYCPNSRIHELFKNDNEIQGTAYRDIIDEIDTVVKNIRTNKNNIRATVNKSVDSFIKFVHSAESSIYQHFGIISAVEHEYDSELSYLLNVKKRFALIGETTYYFFEKISDIESDYHINISEKFKTIIEGFLFPNANNIKKSQKSDSNNFTGNIKKDVKFTFEDNMPQIIRNIHNKYHELEEICSPAQFEVMFENADFSPSLKPNGDVPAVICKVIYDFQKNTIKEKTLRNQWYSAVLSSINRTKKQVYDSQYDFRRT